MQRKYFKKYWKMYVLGACIFTAFLIAAGLFAHSRAANPGQKSVEATLNGFFERLNRGDIAGAL